MPEQLAQKLRQAAQLLQQGGMPQNLHELLLAAAQYIDTPPRSASIPRPASPLADKGVALVLEADGGSRGNPGPAGAGAVLRQGEGGPVIEELSRFLGATTNNVAEYQALIMGLQAALAYEPQNLLIKLDSELLVRQLQGRYQVKSPNLKPLYEQARQLLGCFAQVRLTHIAREYNKLADALANRAMDEG